MSELSLVLAVLGTVLLLVACILTASANKLRRDLFPVNSPTEAADEQAPREPQDELALQRWDDDGGKVPPPADADE
jgi:hypothetical protein